MNNSAAKVGELFQEAGTVFTKLSEMTQMLQPMDNSPPGGKWSDQEVEMLRACINRFAVELNKISQHIKNRTMSHLRRLLEMDNRVNQDISRYPPGQTPPLPHMPANRSQEQNNGDATHLPQQPPQAPRELSLSTPVEQQLPVNIYSQGLPANSDAADDLLHHLNPVIPPPPSHSPEFEDLQESTIDTIRLDIPSIIRLLDLDATVASNNPGESATASIGTLHAEMLSQSCELRTVTLLSREAQFSWRQAQATCGRVSVPVNNDDASTHTAHQARPHASHISSNTDPLRNVKAESDKLRSTCTGHFSSIFTNNGKDKHPFNTIQAPTCNPVEGAPAPPIPTNKPESEERLVGNVISSDFFNTLFTLNSLSNDPVLQTLTGEIDAVTQDAICFNDDDGGVCIGTYLRTGYFSSLFGQNNETNDRTDNLPTDISVQPPTGEPVGSVTDEAMRNSETDNRAVGNFPYSSSFNSVAALITSNNLDNNASRLMAGQALPLSANCTVRSRGRGRSRRPRQVASTTHSPADHNSLPPADSAAGPSQIRITRSRRNQACLTGPPQKKRSRKRAPSETTSRSDRNSSPPADSAAGPSHIRITRSRRNQAYLAAPPQKKRSRKRAPSETTSRSDRNSSPPANSAAGRSQFRITRSRRNQAYLAAPPQKKRSRKKTPSETISKSDRNSSPPADSAAGPSQIRITRSRCSQAYLCNDIAAPPQKKRSRKKAPSETPSRSTTRTNSLKQSK